MRAQAGSADMRPGAAGEPASTASFSAAAAAGPGPGRRNPGFTLLEAMISLAACLIVFTAGLEFIGWLGHRFRDFQEQTGDRQAVMAALEKSRQDLQAAGEGALRALQACDTAAAATSEDRLTLRNGEANFVAAADLPAGAAAVALTGSGEVRPGRTVCIYKKEVGELREVAWTAGRTIGLSAPLENAYAQPETRIVLLEVVEIYLDAGTRTLRRKVNGGSGQPLLEGVRLFHADITASGGPVRLEVALESAPEILYEMSVYPKNAALAAR